MKRLKSLTRQQCWTSELLQSSSHHKEGLRLCWFYWFFWRLLGCSSPPPLNLLLELLLLLCNPHHDADCWTPHLFCIRGVDFSLCDVKPSSVTTLCLFNWSQRDSVCRRTEPTCTEVLCNDIREELWMNSLNTFIKISLMWHYSFHHIIVEKASWLLGLQQNQTWIIWCRLIRHEEKITRNKQIYFFGFL